MKIRYFSSVFALLIILLTACSASSKPAVSIVSTMSSMASSAVSAESSVKSPGSFVEPVVENRSPLVKDEAYWQSLLDSRPTVKYTEEELKQYCAEFSGTIMLFMSADFEKAENIDPEDLLFFLCRLFDEPDVNDDLINSDDLTFVKEEVLDQYAYAYFNLKLDYSTVPGFSKDQVGVWCDLSGYGGGCPSEIRDFKKLGNELYEIDMVFYDIENEDEIKNLPSDVFVYKVEEKRIFVVSHTKVI